MERTSRGSVKIPSSFFPGCAIQNEKQIAENSLVRILSDGERILFLRPR